MFEELFNPRPRDDADQVTVTRSVLRRVLRDECLTVTGNGRGDQVFDALAAAAPPAVPPPAVYAVTGPGQLAAAPVARAAGPAIAEDIARGLSASSGIGGTYASTARGQVTSTFTAGRRDPGPFDGYQVPA